MGSETYTINKNDRHLKSLSNLCQILLILWIAAIIIFVVDVFLVRDAWLRDGSYMHHAYRRAEEMNRYEEIETQANDALESIGHIEEVDEENEDTDREENIENIGGAEEENRGNVFY